MAVCMWMVFAHVVIGDRDTENIISTNNLHKNLKLDKFVSIGECKCIIKRVLMEACDFFLSRGYYSMF